MHLKYRSDIDGLRAIAVLAVIIFHLNNSWLHGGFIGVDIFFVISGYLITKIIYSDIQNNQFSFKVFYQRRINRILPVFFVVMFCTTVVAWYLLLPDEFMLFLKSLKSTTYFWENMFFAQNTGGYWDQSAEIMPILHTWSLAVEEQFYILFPFILLLLIGIRYQSKFNLIKLNAKAILICLILIALASFVLAQLSSKSVFLTKYNYYSLFTGRAGELLIGSIIGILSLHRNKELLAKAPCDNSNKIMQNCYNLLTILGLIAVVLSIIYISGKNLFPSFWAVIPTVGTGLILYFFHPKTIVAKGLSLKPLVFIGKISYSLYLWHWPVIVLARKYLFVEQFTSIKQYFIVALTTIILSLLTYYFIETPARKKNKSFTFSFIAYYLIPSLIILGIYEIQKKTEFLDFRYEKRMALYNLQKQFLNPESNFCHNNIIGNCIFGDLKKEPKVLLIGDSNAAHYAPYLDEAGKKYGFSIQIMTNDRHICALIPEERDKVSSKEFTEKCNQFLKILDSAIKNSNIIMFTTRQENIFHNQNLKFLLDTPLKNYLSFLGGNNRKVVFLSQVPMLNMDEYNRYYNSYLNGVPFKSDHFLLGTEKVSNEFVRKSLVDTNVIYMSPLDSLSKISKENWPIYNGLLAYSKDNNHLNEYVTRQWSQEVLPKQKAFWEKIAKEANELDVVK
ncbi:acyltransferase family protein [Orbus wheelerorum]|uniref:acyltransferase family protein n=1 Tax=Orbus wheelerorum TaxID=3074111 RepID=UPI00370D15D1